MVSVAAAPLLEAGVPLEAGASLDVEVPGGAGVPLEAGASLDVEVPLGAGVPLDAWPSLNVEVPLDVGVPPGAEASPDVGVPLGVGVAAAGVVEAGVVAAVFVDGTGVSAGRVVEGASGDLAASGWGVLEPGPDDVVLVSGSEGGVFEGPVAGVVSAGGVGSAVRLRRRRQKPRGLGVDWAIRFASSWAG
ncbi:hypothetical protein GCM10010530_57190 [Kribbella aluminosa]